jgi:HK97 family phage major capsid protein
MKFEVKSNEELSAMESQDLHAYYTAKLSHEKEQLEARVKALESDDKNEDLAKEVKEMRENTLKTLSEAIHEQGLVMQKLREGGLSANQIKDAEGSIEAILKERSSDFSEAKESRHGFNFTIDRPVSKAVGDMTFAANLSGGNMPQAQRIEGINDIAERVAQAYGRIPKLAVSGNTVDWVYETAQEGAAAGTAEGASKNQIDNNFVVTSVSLLKQTAFFKVSTEMLDDVSFMGAWLRNKLIVRLFLRIDSQVLIGGGTGTDLNGVYTQATTFAAGGFALSVDNANDVDSLVVAANQIRLANHNGALAIFMYPNDVTALKLIKLSATDKRYIDRLMQVGSTMMLDGIPIIETTAMATGTFLIGDLTKALIAEKGGIMVDVGTDGNDFTKNMRTIIAEWRGEVIIENNDVTAFVKGTFATTNAALETA